MALAPGSRLGPYEILAPLGAGAMGEVFRARDSRLDRDVALKVLPESFAADPDRLRRFEQEARAAGRLNHPNILVVHDVGAQDGRPYVVTELLEGETLRERLRAGALPVTKALAIAIQIARGLAAAHAHGIVHRDLKPENLFVLRDGRVKILDFGIAKLTRPHEETGAPAAATVSIAQDAPDTDPGVVLGTLGYMAPEQVRGLPVDHRADLFALGAVLYEMLSGRRAFRGTTPADTLTAILREDPPELSHEGGGIPPALDRIVRHCLEKEPASRFQSAADVAFALETITGISEPARTAELRRSRGAWRNAVPWFAGALLLAVAFWIGTRVAPPRAGPSASFDRVTFQRGILTGAGFAADDRTIFYSAEWEGRSSEIFACDPEAPGSQRSIVRDARLLDISLSNELAVLVDLRGRAHNLAVGTLARMPAAGGAPRRVLENVLEADWSPDGSALAVLHMTGNRYQVEYPIGTVLHASEGWISHMRVSPDGEHVAFLEHPVFPDDRGSVTVVDRKGKRRTLSGPWASVQGLAWAAKGGEIWFTGTQSGVHRALHAVDLGGRVRSLLAAPVGLVLSEVSRSGAALLWSHGVTAGMSARVPGDASERDLTWLDWSIPNNLGADGRTIVFSEQGTGGGSHYSVFLRDIDGSSPVRLGEGHPSDLSPDGLCVLVTRFWETPPRLELLPTGPGEARLLPDTGLETIAGSCFFPDGKRLLIVGNQAGHGTRAYVRQLEGGPMAPTTPEGVVASIFGNLPLSPDGNWMLVNVGEGQRSLYPTSSGRPRPVRGMLADEIALGWSRDSRALYVAKRASGFPLRVFRLDPERGTRTPWLDLDGPEDRAGVKRGVAFVGSDERTVVYSYVRSADDLYVARGLR